MKKTFILLGVISITLVILIGCDGNKSTKENENSIIKDEKLKQIMKEVIIDDGPNSIYWKTVINYNTNGKIVEEIHYDIGDVLKSRYHYTYNEFGDKIEFNIIHPNEEFNNKTIYIYDKSRILIKEVEKENNGNIIRECTYTYDKKGNLVGKDITNSFTYRHEFVYDENNNLKSQIYYNNDGSKDIENFDKYGHQIGNEKNSYKYDDRNNIIEELHVYDNAVSKFSYKYTYNEQGEWVVKKIYFSSVKTELGKLRNTVTREITYYR